MNQVGQDNRPSEFAAKYLNNETLNFKNQVKISLTIRTHIQIKLTLKISISSDMAIPT